MSRNDRHRESRGLDYDGRRRTDDDGYRINDRYSFSEKERTQERRNEPRGRSNGAKYTESRRNNRARHIRNRSKSPSHRDSYEPSCRERSDDREGYDAHRARSSDQWNEGRKFESGWDNERDVGYNVDVCHDRRKGRGPATGRGGRRNGDRAEDHISLRACYREQEAETTPVEYAKPKHKDTIESRRNSLNLPREERNRPKPAAQELYSKKAIFIAFEDISKLALMTNYLFEDADGGKMTDHSFDGFFKQVIYQKEKTLVFCPDCYRKRVGLLFDDLYDLAEDVCNENFPSRSAEGKFGEH